MPGASLFLDSVIASALSSIPGGGVGPGADRRALAASIGAYTTSEQELVDRLAGALRPGTVNLADRNFFSMRRFLAFAATGTHLLWRVENPCSTTRASPRPVRSLRAAPLHECPTPRTGR
jgi:hypothetical protein